MARFDMQTVTLGTLLDDPDAVALIERASPGITSHPMVGFVRGMKAQDALAMATATSQVDSATLDALVRALGDLQ